MNPLNNFAQEYAEASAEVAKAWDAFRARMEDAATEAHTAGVTRYMAQKATGAPVSEVNAWFGDLPTAKPGRRRKDDPVYA